LFEHAIALSTDTDLHSLAALLFNLWVWHHPLHGLMEYQFRSWDLIAKTKVYGKDPVFIFDPVDARNALPNDPEYQIAGKRWRDCPPSLQALFTKAFTTGLKEPSRRVTEGQWQDLFLQLKDGTIFCLSCKAENLWDATSPVPRCWHCKQPVTVPPRLVLHHVRGAHYLVLGTDTKLLGRHLHPLSEEGAAEVLGQVVQNPANPRIWGIRNLTKSPWQAVLPDGTSKEYAPQIAVPLNPGIKLTIAGIVAEIVA
jgi:eukaryotic-like serine/threonine-protein kinase